MKDRKISSLWLLGGLLGVVLLTGLIAPAYAQQIASGGTPTPGPGPTFEVFFNTPQQCIVIDFEGLGNLVPVGTLSTPLGDVTFILPTVSAIDADAGGAGNFANEPSPDTVIVNAGIPGPLSLIEMTLDHPAQKVSWHYTSPFDPLTVKIYDVNNNLITTIIEPTTANNAGDPNGAPFSEFLPNSFTTGGQLIKRVEWFGPNNQYALDDIDLCVLPVGGELLPSNTAALLIAGIQSSALWIIPFAVSAIGIGAVLIRKKSSL